MATYTQQRIVKVSSLCVVLLTGAWLINSAYAKHDESDEQTLKSPEAFQHLDDKEAFSKAVFNELGKVLQHPRCVNCHADGDVPLQGDTMQPHQPTVKRGPNDMGVPGMMCMTCHMPDNVQVSKTWAMPGHQPWKMAPISQIWENKSIGDICRQMKDNERNGGMSLDDIIHHVKEDGLVGWGWHPGEGREKAPGSQKIAGELTQAWVESGAGCPE